MLLWREKFYECKKSKNRHYLLAFIIQKGEKRMTKYDIEKVKPIWACDEEVEETPVM